MKRAILLCAWAGVALPAFSRSTADAPSPAAAPVLDTYSYFRSFIQFAPAVSGVSADAAAPIDDPKTKRPARLPRTPPAPADWAAPDFDDAEWWRSSGPVQGGYGWARRGSCSQELARLHLRGRFAVDDPAAVKALRLSVEYRGGVVAYLNGVEIARGHVPAGPVSPQTLAEPYPIEAYTADGQTGIPYAGNLALFADRLNLRLRRLAVPIPPARLVKGVNVLAVEVLRAPIHPDSLKFREAWKTQWATLGLCGLELSADPASAVAANTARPAGIRVWNADPASAVFDLDYGDPNEPVRPIRIVGTANGRFLGQVVVGADQPIKGLRAEVSPLVMDGSAGSARVGRIAPAAVTIYWPQPTGIERGAESRFRGVKTIACFDALAESPPAEAAVRSQPPLRGYAGPQPRFGSVQPILLSVAPPADAPPGRYRGALTIDFASPAGGQPVRVPVELDLRRWKLPDVGAFACHLGAVQSPESLALYYKVAPWSEAHWKLIDRSLRLLGEHGNNAIFIPVIARHHFGKEGLVRWMRRPDGKFDCDFSVFDRYLETALRHMPRPQVVCLYAWDLVYSKAPGRWSARMNEPKPVPVSTFDPASGQVGEMAGPAYDSPAAEAFFRPAFDGMLSRLEARGVPAEAIMVGMASDKHPHDDEVKLFARLAPGAQWVLQSHTAAKDLAGVPVGYGSYVWATHAVPDPAANRYYGWRGERIVTVFPRAGASPGTLFPHSPLGECRSLPEMCLAGDLRGIGRVGADFFPVADDTRTHDKGTLVGRYATGEQVSLWEATVALLAPGPDGAVGTLRLALIHQGMQEAEARIAVERALTDPTLKAKLDDSLAGRCQELLDRRAERFIACQFAWPWFAAGGWRESAGELYDAAAEVADALHTR